MVEKSEQLMGKEELDALWAKIKNTFFASASFTQANIQSTLGISNWALAASKPSYTYSEVGAAASSHTHGNIQNGGTLQTNDISVANGDKIVVTDASDSAKVARTSIAFDASTTTKALTPKGTWETFLQGNQTITLSGDVSGSGTTSIAVTIGAGKVTNSMLAGSIANSKLASAGKFTIGSTAIELGTTYTAANFRSYLGLGGAATYGATSSVTDGGTSLVTSGGVYSYVNALLTAAMKIEGETATAISDGSTTNPVTIGGQSVTAYKGMVVFYGSKEFVWVGTSWKELGDEGSFALKTTTVTGTGYLTGGGALSANQTIDIASSVKTKIDNGATAYGWGNHASAGYVKTVKVGNDSYSPTNGVVSLPAYPYAVSELVNDLGFTANTGTVTSVTIKGSGAIVVDYETAITGIGTRTISHATSGATAGSYGDSAAQTPAYGGTFKVPYVTVDAQGHVTAISEHTVKIPASDNTWRPLGTGATDCLAGNTKYAGSDSQGGPAQTVKGAYTANGGQQNPNYFGTNKVGFLMMNTTVNSNSNYKDWIIMDCYSGSGVGGSVAFGVNRQALGAYIMRSAAARTSWAESAELIGTHNYTTYTVKKDGTGASGTWGISVTGSSASCTGNAATATDADKLDGQHGSYYATASSVTTLQGYFSSGILKLANGGTGSSTAAGARANLGTWALVSDSYNTLMPADGTTNGWIKIGTSNTSYGLLPSASGGAGSGHNYIGTSSWYWKYAYIDQIYGYLNGNISGSAVTLKNTRTIWGQNFNGSANVSGNMTGVGSIIASGDIYTTASVIGDKGVSSKGIANLSVAAISGSNFVTQVKIGSTAYNPSDGVVSLPAYPTVPTALSGFTNDVGYLSGTVAVANGGTGATTASAARTNLGLGSVATLNTGSDTTKFLRNDGSWAVPAYPTVPTFSSLTLSTTAQKYDGTHTLALPASDPYTSARTPASHTHGNIQNGGTLNDTAAAAAGNDYVVIRDADNNKIQTSTIKGTDVADAVSKKHSHSSLTLSTTAQAYDGTNTLKLPASDPYSSARTPSAHATNSTTYGAGTTTNYGHVKLVTGDMNGATNTDGEACSKNHTHSQYLTSHQSVVNGGNTASWGASVTVGTVGGTALTFTMPANPNTDTKNTTGADNTTSKIYLVGPTAQTSSNGNARTYSNSECYASGGYLYSKGKIVANRMETPQPQSGSATITLNGTEVPSYQMFDINSTSYLTKTLNHPSSYGAQSGFSYILISNSTSSEATINMPSGCIAPASSFKIGAGKSVEVSYFYNGNNVAVIMWSTALQAIS